MSLIGRHLANCSQARVLSRSLHLSKMAPVKVGDAMPSVDLFEGAPDKKVNLAKECASGKFVVFGVPGAFTPHCSNNHLPGQYRYFVKTNHDPDDTVDAR